MCNKTARDLPYGMAIKLKTKNQIQVFHPTFGSAMAIGPAYTVKKAAIHWQETLRENPMWRYLSGMISVEYTYYQQG